jgi:hypothetical protein
LKPFYFTHFNFLKVSHSKWLRCKKVHDYSDPPEIIVSTSSSNMLIRRILYNDEVKNQSLYPWILIYYKILPRIKYKNKDFCLPWLSTFFELAKWTLHSICIGLMALCLIKWKILVRIVTPFVRILIGHLYYQHFSLFLPFYHLLLDFP